MSSPFLRGYRNSDRWDCFDVCVRTADAGADARGRFSTDDLMPDLFCAPYLQLDPRSAFVIESDGRVVGYAIAASNTPDFVRRYRSHVLPWFATKYPLPNPVVTREDQLVALGHDPERLLIPEVDEYPAHLHMDLLPEAQRRGYGRQLVDALTSALAARDIPGIHLTMLNSNTDARAFYDRLGFRELERTETITTLAMKLRSERTSPDQDTVE